MFNLRAHQKLFRDSYGKMREVQPDGAGISNPDSFDSNSILNSLDSWVSNLLAIFQAFKYFRLDQDSKTREMLPF